LPADSDAVPAPPVFADRREVPEMDGFTGARFGSEWEMGRAAVPAASNEALANSVSPALSPVPDDGVLFRASVGAPA
jgi:hypothetical protein